MNFYRLYDSPIRILLSKSVNIEDFFKGIDSDKDSPPSILSTSLMFAWFLLRY